MQHSAIFLPGKRRLARLSRKNHAAAYPRRLRFPGPSPPHPMVAQRSSARFVPFSFLAGASCLLPEATLARTHPVPPRPGFEIAAESRALAADLTAAEQRVCDLLLRGLSNKEIASELGRAEPTIKNQVAAVLRKHAVPSRARLLALLR
ncbi:MAG: hypothetical protein C0518_07900 [Opitutus sp.]|nr:hypothetical protein [Opitutus sp.]